MKKRKTERRSKRPSKFSSNDAIFCTSPIYSSLCQWVCVRALISVSSYCDFGCLCHCHSHLFIVFFCSDIRQWFIANANDFFVVSIWVSFPTKCFSLAPTSTIFCAKIYIAFIIDEKKRAQRKLYSVHTKKHMLYVLSTKAPCINVNICGDFPDFQYFCWV